MKSYKSQSEKVQQVAKNMRMSKYLQGGVLYPIYKVKVYPVSMR